jgi:hypothetical protein
MSQPEFRPNVNPTPDYMNDPEFKTLLIKFKKQCLKYLDSRYLTVLIVGIGISDLVYYTVTLDEHKFHLRRTIKTKYCEQLTHFLTLLGVPKNDEIEPPVTFNFKPTYDYFLVGNEKLKQIK